MVDGTNCTSAVVRIAPDQRAARKFFSGKIEIAAGSMPCRKRPCRRASLGVDSTPRFHRDGSRTLAVQGGTGMCGIIGYTGSRQAEPILLAGLHRLEYRGYDSAGLATVTGSHLHLRKKAGRIQDL